MKSSALTNNIGLIRELKGPETVASPNGKTFHS